MGSRWLLDLLLIVAVAALALIAWFQPGIEQPPETQPLTTLSPETVAHIRITRAGQDALALERDTEGRWFLDHQPPLPADAAQVAALTRLATQEPERSYSAGELELDRLALAPPAATVMFDDTRFEFGATDPLEGLRYVRNGERVYLVPDIYQHLIDAGPERFLRRRLIPEQGTITALSLPGLSLEKQQHKWLVTPEQDVAADRVQRLVEQWQQAAALDVTIVAADVRDEDNTDHIEVTLAEPAQNLEFVIVAREPELVLLRPELGLRYRMGEAGNNLLALPSADAGTADSAP